MDLLKKLTSTRLLVVATIAIFLAPAAVWAEDFKTFTSEEYGFTMKYPGTWVKIDRPKGNYYVVFQSPNLIDNFRNRIHVAAHEPVKDQLKVFLDELRNGIADLQKKGAGGQETQQVKILDEGEFKCDVPGAYYFFIQAFENKLNIWMDIVIVFFKHDKTLLRISCLAPSSAMEKMQPFFNEVLVSVAFNGQGPAPSSRTGTQPPAAREPAPAAPQPRAVRPAPAPAPAPAPPRTGLGVRPSGPSTLVQPEEETEEVAPAPRSAPRGPAPAPRGPGRGPERPPTGIVN